MHTEVGGRSPQPAQPVAPTVQAAFEAETATLERGLQGRLGICARHLESGETIGVNAEERFPMASTYKLPIAGTLLSLVDRGKVSLEQMVSITASDRDQTGDIAQSVPHAGVSLSVANLLELMLTQSNNNATDRIIALAGGPTAVTAWLRSIGIRDIRVDNNVNDLLNKFYGFPPGSPSTKTFLARWRTEEERERAAGYSKPEFDENPEDTATPGAMAQLLGLLFAGPVLSAHSSCFLRAVMTRCQTGLARIRGRLPPGAVVADKTGTVGGTVNDVGIIELPGDRGQVAIAVFTKKSSILSFTARERFIAEISRSAYDYFRFRV
jgi:beta-lactamase class A